MNAKRIAIFSQFYDPEPCAASNRVASMARAFAKAGYAVTVVTGMPTFPSGVVAAAYRGIHRCEEMADGIRIVRRRAHAAPPGAPAGRLRNWLSLAAVLTKFAFRELGETDVVVASSPPITITIPALVASWRRRAALVVDVRDVFPEMGVSLGVWRSEGIVARTLGYLIRRLYERAALVIVVTESARQSILCRGVPISRIVLAPNGFDFSETIRVRSLPRTATFNVAYAGNMGLATGVGMILDAAKLLGDKYDVHFTLAGGGVEAQHIAGRIEAEGITNVRFVGVLTRTESLQLLADADATVVPLHGQLTDAVPSKMYDALAVGCPMILSARGEAQRLLEATGCGIGVEPNDARSLADGIVRCIENRESLLHRTTAGQAYVRQNFDRERIMTGVAARIRAIA